MPSNRRSNAAGKAVGKGSGARRAPRGRGSAEKARQGLSSTANDIIGVVLAVAAVAMFVSLVAPTSAIVTSVVGRVLTLFFGTGAILAPIALFIFACTFFMDDDGPISGRVAAGLVLIVLAILAMLSLNHPGVADDPEAALAAPALESAGGWVGGGIAYALVRLVGLIVGNVVLAGVIVAGAVVCGFSISGAVAKIHLRAQAASESRRLAREERAAAREAVAAPAGPAAPAPSAQGSLFDETGEGETSFIGARKTSVLRRGRPKRGGAADGGEPDADATTLLDAAPTTPLETPTRASKKRSPRVSAEKQSAGASPADRSHAPKPSAPTAPSEADDDKELPPADMLKVNPDSGVSAESDEALSSVAAKLQGTLEEFGLTSRVVGWVAGPSVTTFKIEMGEGERVSKITNLQDDIALSLASRSVRIFAPIPGTSLVGIEIPNKTTQPVYLGDVLPYVKGGPLEAAFGRDSEGNPVVVDLAGLPHLLVAGTTGSGKSVLLNSIVMTVLMRATPDEVRLIMVDPKRVEFTYYAGLPHLYVPVVTEPNKAASALSWGVTEMERRLKVFEHYKVRDIKSYNRDVDGDKYADMENPPKHMPYFVIVIDELSDLMMVAGKDVEASIVRIAQLGRAAGIHLVVATQRPSADVVTGLIKANIDNRVALSVDNGMNSRIILDQTGAERLLGHGDMLYKLRGKRPRRAQGCFVSEGEVERVVDFIKEHHDTDYHDDILTAVSPMAPGGAGDPAAPADDPLLWEAADIVVNSQLGSTSSLQRALSVGYARAGRIMDMLENKGVVGPANGSKPREVLLDKEGLEDLKAAEQDFEEV
ncbi:MAG: DNA translocase FtsK 4TM domain-containing protein [Coriobacteriaceae bacterium]|uniref:FtsK/SpoIIIE family DNA translocase n=1 Tax=Tractidigestivibacter sp. TaxID=2847320 RepID=UPI002A913EFC|nr:DNA translocase FtsK 4TM domain-containing protein [Tractidigestivibacter sp.]MCI6273826.1 DNA translocase FtsK 4TM domain-containing protein [Coriobacteriaceae bacterium]MCI7438330.1 DNA translocase FtsK 4TM domain-containing protein [Coriobacteriaceae bacterium]MDD7583424.1 DNA translocase FtsK 4TM domain-containing protein [Coriobacteriaceae bacterium]MDY5272477.1 DNA translocase FtsK 4TM domain-containing protein [Tractidigestivibacter sp.]